MADNPQSEIKLTVSVSGAADAKAQISGVSTETKRAATTATSSIPGFDALANSIKSLKNQFNALRAAMGFIGLLFAAFAMIERVKGAIAGLIPERKVENPYKDLADGVKTLADDYDALTESIRRNQKAMEDNLAKSKRKADSKNKVALAKNEEERQDALRGVKDPEERRRINEKYDDRATDISFRNDLKKSNAERDHLTKSISKSYADEAAMNKTIEEARKIIDSGRERLFSNEEMTANDRESLRKTVNDAIDVYDSTWKGKNDLRTERYQNTLRFQAWEDDAAAMHSRYNAQRTGTQNRRDQASWQEEKRKEKEAQDSIEKRKREIYDENARKGKAREKEADIRHDAKGKIDSVTLPVPQAVTSIGAIGGMMGAAAPRAEDRMLERMELVAAITQEMNRNIAKITAEATAVGEG